ncbi:MAG: phosphate acetyltransferase [Candidatus Nanopelagicales bacterium]|nr:phosphate acetyltransferase [Candidatus Nanopelagicales bacterium]MDZ4250640.1 phosphate acetyltransferase [Candidatus Nanopelagicales bacterium]
MTPAVYITSVEPESGKSIVSLGCMEEAAARTGQLGYFRPVIKGGDELDPVIELMRSRYHLAQTYDQSFGATTDDVALLGESAPRALLDRVLSAYDSLTEFCDAVVIEGTDFAGASAAFEFALNAQMASELGAPALVVVNARRHPVGQVHGVLDAARKSFDEHKVPVFGFIVSRVIPEQMSALVDAGSDVGGVPIWLLPDEPSLALPTVADVAGAMDAKVLAGSGAGLARTISTFAVGAMSLAHVMERLHPEALVIVPGDRSDIILLALVGRFSSGIPPVSGLLLTGGYEPDPALLRFARGLRGESVPVLLTAAQTYETVERLSHLQGSLTSGDRNRVELAVRLFEDNMPVEQLVDRLSATRSDAVTPVMFARRLLSRARADKRRIVLPEGSDPRVLAAADRLLRMDAVDVTVLGDPDGIADKCVRAGLDLSSAAVINPWTSELRDGFAAEILRKRKAKGMTEESAHDLSGDPTWFGTMMVNAGLADGMVSGATHTTADTVRPALQIIRTAPGTSVVSSVFLMAMSDRVLVYGDCAVIPDPDERQLADIALSSARTARAFGIDPYVAMLSYSTGSSGSGEDVQKVAAATAIVRELEPDLPVEGPIQYDAAVDPGVAAAKLPGSAVAGHATVLVFPDLNTGNNTYKAVQRSSGAQAMGPILQGLRLPVNDLSRGATVEDIVNTVIITALQAQQIQQRSS